MVRESSRYLGLCPEIFSSIDTPPISTNIDVVSHGIPTYATLEVLISYLTAANSVNYDTVAEFLMVYRSFASATELWRLLASRLLWAADQAARAGSANEIGTTIGTRCFVMIRMWIRDYFVQDFVPNTELRSVVAETVTALAGCTEFILLEHFNLIMAQLRLEWDTQINKYWVLSPEYIGNVDTAVPMGGEPLLLNERKTPSYILSGSIPIDADIAVPSIQESPKKLRPKNKVTNFFLGGRRSGVRIKNEEVVLHNKVDILAMKIINEYHERDRRNTTALHQTIRTISSQEPFANQPLANETFANTPFSNAPYANSSTFSNNVFAKDAYFSEPTLFGETTPNSDHRHDSYFLPRRVRRHEPIHNAGKGPDSDVVDSKKGKEHTESDSAVRNHPVSQIFTKTPEIIINQPDTDSMQGETGGLGTPSSTGSVLYNDKRNATEEQGKEDLLDQGIAYPSECYPGEGTLGEAHPGEHQREGQGGQSLEEQYPGEQHTGEDTVEHHGEEHIGEKDSREGPEEEEEEEEEEEDERLGWATPTRSIDSFSQQRSDEDRSAGMTHEQSRDTLNVNNMVLANTTGDSVFEESLRERQSTLLEGIYTNQSSVSTLEKGTTIQEPRIPDNWNMDMDFDNFDRVSFVGSSLSTLSTSTRSAFSVHAPKTPQSVHHPFDSSFPAGRNSSRAISLMSEIENSLLQPCEGYTPMDAARLRALPDSKLEGDAILATLNKLEGISTDKDRGVSYEEVGSDLQEAPELITRSGRGEVGNEPPSDRLAEDVTGLGISTNFSPYVREESRLEATQAPMQEETPKARHEATPESTPKPKQEQKQQPLTGLGISQYMPSHSYSSNTLRAQHTRDSQASFINQPDIPKPLPTLHIGLPGSTHAPFILSYNARSVAEQMTLIESEIAKELDWQQLIHMNHTDNITRDVTSWLQIVMDEIPLHGVDLVMARFDLVYKWVQSEVLLCPTAALQAQAVSRFIHIAFESLRLQNFATMTQLVLALSSSEVESKLGMEYFNLLPVHDRETLDLLQSLASSANNYAKLRKAHNRFSWAKGCVPYTPMFLNDIKLISSSASINAENEIHFGKYHATAKVVNALKYCVESGSKYNIELDNTLISKCLHLASA